MQIILIYKLGLKFNQVLGLFPFLSPTDYESRTSAASHYLAHQAAPHI